MVLIIAVLIILCAEQALLADILQTPDTFTSNCGTDRQLSFATIGIKSGDGYEYFCGGALINTHNVLTSKSCAKKHPETTIYASFENGGTIIKVQKVTVLNKSPDDRGISLLKLEQPVTSNAKVQPLCIPGMHKIGSSLMYKDDQDVEVWTDTGDKIESTLVTNILITSNEECAACFGDVQDLICAKKSNLPDHIGGILIKKMDETHIGMRFVILGLFTELEPDCKDKEMVAIIDVTHYLTWMSNNLDLTKSRRAKTTGKCNSEKVKRIARRKKLRRKLK